MPICTVTSITYNKQGHIKWHIHLYGIPACLENDLKSRFPELVAYGKGPVKYWYVGSQQIGIFKDKTDPVVRMDKVIRDGRIGHHVDVTCSVLSIYLNYLDENNYKVVTTNVASQAGMEKVTYSLQTVENDPLKSFMGQGFKEKW
ncbi:uncharacterized protein LOC110854717 isoform X2 [Folsomia candida]|uniref:uncharacterized protein LOC110854717 isoform X2 n=1 Tax=Folsomia candida TaxID=158441 RepID=UPI000B8F18D8|nr:uncharacterized protein LOC110854717 isoform X2 [Folsomia candida]